MQHPSVLRDTRSTKTLESLAQRFKESMDWDSESLTRMTLPIRSLSYSPSGLQLVAAGDDGIIKHVNVSSKSVRACACIKSRETEKVSTVAVANVCLT